MKYYRYAFNENCKNPNTKSSLKIKFSKVNKEDKG